MEIFDFSMRMFWAGMAAMRWKFWNCPAGETYRRGFALVDPIRRSGSDLKF
jgi:hypothetical protein